LLKNILSILEKVWSRQRNSISYHCVIKKHPFPYGLV